MRWWLKLKKNWRRITTGLFFFLLGIGLWVGMDLSKKVQILFGEATSKKAEIVIDVKKELGPISQGWKNLVQGGEEVEPMLDDVVVQVAALNPSYIRIDHIYDFYEVVRKENGQLIFSFTKLDQVVDDILQTGAKPFLALSYMPPGLGEDITAAPDDWADWQLLVQKTIEHYSGRNGKNIDQVYYEVWNEPDLFGGWKIWGEKNYLELYKRAAFGAVEAQNVNSFKLGGPATTGLYKNWVTGLLKMVSEKNLKFDFISWHRYSFEIDDFSDDVEKVNNWLGQYPTLAYKEKIITEWGFDPENHPGYDGMFAAAHAVGVIREMLGGVHSSFLFEIKDGPSPTQEKFWGRWGLITHENAGLMVKPRYEVMKWLNQLKGTRLGVEGEGSFVRAMAVTDKDKIQVYLVNYDRYERHQETVPVTIKNLIPGKYRVIVEKFKGTTEQTGVVITSGTFIDEISLEPNQIARIMILK